MSLVVVSLGLPLWSDEVGVPEVRHTDCTRLEPGDGHAQPVKKQIQLSLELLSFTIDKIHVCNYISHTMILFFTGTWVALGS